MGWNCMCRLLLLDNISPDIPEWTLHETTSRCVAHPLRTFCDLFVTCDISHVPELRHN